MYSYLPVVDKVEDDLQDCGDQHRAGGEDHEGVGLVVGFALLHLSGDQTVEQDVPGPDLVCCNVRTGELRPLNHKNEYLCSKEE